MSDTEYYDLLGISPTATAQEIRQAYKQRALQSHPDRPNGDEELFKCISSAYEVLSDPEQRRLYDQYGKDMQRATSPNFPNFSGMDPFNLFNFIFKEGGQQYGRPPPEAPRNQVQRPQDIYFTLDLTYAELYYGCTKKLAVRRKRSCGECHGRGVVDQTIDINCLQCKGSGRQTLMRRTPLGFSAHVEDMYCSFCKGSGIKAPATLLKCESCKGKRQVEQKAIVTTTIDPGTPEGYEIISPGEGDDAQIASEPRGDIVLTIKTKPLDGWKRRGQHLIYTVPITLANCITGLWLEIPHVSGNTLQLTYDNVVQPDTTLVFEEWGMPAWKTAPQGALYVCLQVQYPTEIVVGDAAQYIRQALGSQSQMEQNQSFETPNTNNHTQDDDTHANDAGKHPVYPSETIVGNPTLSPRATRARQHHGSQASRQYSHPAQAQVPPQMYATFTSFSGGPGEYGGVPPDAQCPMQ